MDRHALGGMEQSKERSTVRRSIVGTSDFWQHLEYTTAQIHQAGKLGQPHTPISQSAKAGPSAANGGQHIHFRRRQVSSALADRKGFVLPRR